ncbi:probable tyrosyl-DNA phosphodiesterase isoform X2 [Daktulosphaira vitifoliae]|uniref:probable tyrosyl-DNA phosphodiesterase isoform X1 n=1 Tax=Daktulosphaira vitifoliae TaxID=58002 RepID=UPI0021A9BB50|nr:probable tyrosyl-DNA phosphodiesterase isoform X1 [Daktulosphaira vitifoliae]XP_050548769.1 probable tyrosyl-DNA phosphodiesterase isoform X2 [Daktulosphaira vitifoliae]
MSMNSQKRKACDPDSYSDSVWKQTKGNVVSKLKYSEPFGFFLSAVDSNPLTHSEDLTLSFPELLDKSLGDLKESLHINFMVELGWLLAQYYITNQRGKTVYLLYEHCDEDLNTLKTMNKIPNLRFTQVKPQNVFGHHHTKMSMFLYSDGSIRIVVMTANLREEDWTNLTQGIWVSPKFPQLHSTDKHNGESTTGFKNDILRYLQSYKVELLENWIQRIKKTDFSSAKVFFISSIPGKHFEPLWGQTYLRNILKTHAHIPSGSPSDWPIISQCSSIGSLGANEKDWLTSEFIFNLSSSTQNCKTDNNIPFNLIYPTVNNVLNSWDGPMGGFCLPYSDKVHQKQVWLKNYMCKWVSHSRNRTKAVPHIKSYCRISPCCSEMSWFLLTSANLSKAAWGRETKSDRSNYFMSHEVGILFLPQFLVGCDTFSINQTQNGTIPSFPIPFDLPLTPYSKSDQPWRADIVS